MASGTFDILHPGHVFYLEEAKKLGGTKAELFVIIATDKTVEKHKRIPIMPQDQRAELISKLEIVDKVFIGNEGNPFKIVQEIQPDIIAIGPDQKFSPIKLQKQLEDIGLRIKVVKIEDYKKFELDSTCKIIKKIKQTHFDEKVFEDCD
ncbi:MAG: FAD synthase [Methanosphaera sp.]|uniref:adenylyltransferase/cytidyltransferase family protein n=1 Tax=Methanosphaera sp. ISO3-F5 TaxID=1452353 RepID=UPI002B257645|nr:adenylyltransferase/cytidyltransferase family protein [Methanosphaera sp. ISO3-F5]MBR0472764.1 FAD synthase [Methanosphaera sp.]WQH63222.1 FAD synthase [Methanosphaera sp. ISO3-F5]